MEFLPGCMIYVTRSLSRRYSPGTATVQMSNVILADSFNLPRAQPHCKHLLVPNVHARVAGRRL